MFHRTQKVTMRKRNLAEYSLPQMLSGFSNLSLAHLSRDLRCCILSIIMDASSSDSVLSWLSLAVGGLACATFVNAVFSLSNYSQLHQYTIRSTTTVLAINKIPTTTAHSSCGALGTKWVNWELCFKERYINVRFDLIFLVSAHPGFLG